MEFRLESSSLEVGEPRNEPENPKPYAINPKTYTLNPKPETLNPKPGAFAASASRVSPRVRGARAGLLKPWGRDWLREPTNTPKP